MNLEISVHFSQIPTIHLRADAWSQLETSRLLGVVLSELSHLTTMHLMGDLNSCNRSKCSRGKFSSSLLKTDNNRKKQQQPQTKTTTNLYL